jgi:hypothetical protein
VTYVWHFNCHSFLLSQRRRWHYPRCKSETQDSPYRGSTRPRIGEERLGSITLLTHLLLKPPSEHPTPMPTVVRFESSRRDGHLLDPTTITLLHSVTRDFMKIMDLSPAHRSASRHRPTRKWHQPNGRIYRHGDFIVICKSGVSQVISFSPLVIESIIHLLL